MDTVLLRMSWLKATKNLTDSQYRELIDKICIYGFTECTEEVSSCDPVVNAMLEVLKPSVRENVANYMSRY